MILCNTRHFMMGVLQTSQGTDPSPAASADTASPQIGAPSGKGWEEEEGDEQIEHVAAEGRPPA
jgi:hypothetical protein